MYAFKGFHWLISLIDLHIVSWICFIFSGNIIAMHGTVLLHSDKVLIIKVQQSFIDGAEGELFPILFEK